MQRFQKTIKDTRDRLYFQNQIRSLEVLQQKFIVILSFVKWITLQKETFLELIFCKIENSFFTVHWVGTEILFYKANYTKRLIQLDKNKVERKHWFVELRFFLRTLFTFFQIHMHTCSQCILKARCHITLLLHEIITLFEHSCCSYMQSFYLQFCVYAIEKWPFFWSLSSNLR